MSEENLKACEKVKCPFCGNEPKRYDWGEVECNYVGCAIYGIIIHIKQWNTRQSADVEGAIELIDININSLALTEDRFPIIFGTECTKILTTIKNKLQGASK